MLRSGYEVAIAVPGTCVAFGPALEREVLSLSQEGRA
jgi:hypothetical protein